MDKMQCISVNQARHYLDQGLARLIDIRDSQSFAAAHVSNAFHLTQASLGTLVQQQCFSTPLLVLCYHGHSSKAAAQYLVTQGFKQVYSVDGGFAAWHEQFPQHIKTAMF